MKFKILVLLAASFFSALAASAQCAMCRASVENNVSNGDTSIGRGSFIGSGTIIKEGLSIGTNSLVGMGLSIRKGLIENSKRLGEATP